MLIPSQTHPKVVFPNIVASFSSETDPWSEQRTSTESAAAAPNSVPRGANSQDHTKE